jgi:hypothetical protein
LESKLSSADIDKVDTEAIVLLFFNDEKPLKGAAGLIDWRMNGTISDLIFKDKINGREGESILIVPKKRIRGKKILMIGLGDSSTFSGNSLEKTAGNAISQLAKIGVKKFHLAIPPKQFTSLSTPDAARFVIKGMVSMIEKEKINESTIFVTLSIDKADMYGTKLSLYKLRREMKGKGFNLLN